MPKITIRPAGEGDIPAVVALYRQLDQALVDLQPEFFCVAPRGDEFVRQAVKTADADYLLAEEDGAVVGFALVNYAGWTPEFSCVLPHRYACLADLVVGHWQYLVGRRQALGAGPPAGIPGVKRPVPERPRHRPVRIPRLRRGDTGYAVYAVKQ